MLNLDEYINNFYKGTKNNSLDAMEYFMDEYNFFEKEMKFIHIAGTNGKGSCTEMVSNILVKQGYKVGKFLSPHLIKYNERMSINGINISDSEMIELIEELQPKIDKYNKNNEVPVTLFELWTIMSLLYFYRNNVDFVVMEVGLGGINDSTNIISKPLVSIISSIGYDHIQILGSTLPDIAKQKAGIIKQDSNTVIIKQNEEVNNIFVKKCTEKNNTLHCIEKNKLSNYHYDEQYQYFDYGNMKEIKINLKGIKQIENAAICIETMKILNQYGYNVSEDSIREGLSTVVHRGRMEVINDKPLVIYDGGHNEPAINNLKNTIDTYYSNYKKLYIISILKRKDYKKILEILLEDKDAKFLLTSGNDPKRYTSGEELYKTAKKIKMDANISINTLEEALKIALKTQSDTVSFVVGSFYTYGSVIDIIKEINNK